MLTAADISDLLVNCVGAGPIGIAGLGIAEKVFPFVPSYVVFVLIGMAVVISHGDLTFAIAAIAFGSTAGSLCWYGLGLTLGRTRSQAFVERFGRVIGLTPARYLRVVDAYQRNLLLITAVGQTIPAVRVYIAIPAGVLNVSIRRFTIGTFIGSLMWSTPLLVLGYVVGESSSDPASAALLLIAALIALECLLLLGWRVVRRGQQPKRLVRLSASPPSQHQASATPLRRARRWPFRPAR